MNNEKNITPNAPADFTPTLGKYNDLQPFRYWCHKVLPLVYDDSLSYYELLCKVVAYLNETMEDVETLYGDITKLHSAYAELQSYVNNYFSSLDVQEEINNKLDDMADSGELYEIIRKYTDPIVNEQNEKIDVLKSRMDTFTSLPSGSTSGDAELIDIRVGYNGVTYPSAGDAVREQVGELKGDIVEIKRIDGLVEQYIKNSSWKNKKYFDWNESHTKPQENDVDDSVWNCIKIVNLPSGTYHYNYAFPKFSFIENILTGDVIDCSSILEDTNGVEKIFSVDYDFNLYLTVAKNPAINIVMVSNGTLPNYFAEDYYSLKDMTVNGNRRLIVGKGEKYETIQSACDVANNEDIIFIKCGTYTENVKLWGKRVHLIGENKLNTILIDHSGNYNTPPLEMSDGSVSNMTIIQDNANPTGTEGDGKYGNSYCIHADWLPVSGGNVFEIDNCILINKVWSCIGIGLQADYTVRIRNTQMIGESSQPVSTLFCHDSAQDYNYLQYLIVQNCMISSKGGKCVQIDKTTAEGGEAWYQFDGCTIYDENLGTINDIVTLTSADNFTKHRSYGNTVQLLNN